jgi:hypothetical protein
MAELNLCCRDPGNMRTDFVSTVDLASSAPIDDPKEIQICQVCGRRHYRMLAEPGHFGIELQPTGGKKDGNV